MEHDSLQCSIGAINLHYVIHESPALNEAKSFRGKLFQHKFFFKKICDVNVV